MQNNKQNSEDRWGSLNYFNKLNFKNYSLTFLFIIALYIVLLFTFDSSDPFSYLGGVYVNVLIYIVFAVSLNVVVGLMGQLSLGHAGFIAIGGYSAAYISKMIASYNLPPFLHLVAVSLFGGTVAAIFGFLVGVLAILIRVFNTGYPEGAMLAVLLMNAFAPLIDYFVVEANIRHRLKRAKNLTK